MVCFFKATILSSWTKRGLFCMAMSRSCWRPRLLGRTHCEKMVNVTFSSNFTFFYVFSFFLRPPRNLCKYFVLIIGFDSISASTNSEPFSLRAQRQRWKPVHSGRDQKKKKIRFPLSSKNPAGFDRVVSTRDKRWLCLLVLNIPIRVPTMAAFVRSHVRVRREIPLPLVLCKTQFNHEIKKR